MASKKQAAINSLNQHLLALEAITDRNQGNTWKCSLKDTLDLYIGKDSSITKRLDVLFFTKKEKIIHTNAFGAQEKYVFDASKKENFKALIESAVTHVSNHGVIKDASNNFLGHLSTTGLWSWLGPIGVGLVATGMFFGNLQKEREVISIEAKYRELEQQSGTLKKENNVLKDSLSKYSLQLKK